MAGPGSGDGARAEAARGERRRALEAQLYSGDQVSPAELDELRALLGLRRPDVVGRPSASAEVEAEAEAEVEAEAGTRAAASAEAPSAAGSGRTRPPRPGRAWLAAAAVAILLAGFSGAGIAESVAGSRAPADGTGLAATTVAVPRPTRAGAVSDTLGSEYFAHRQTAGDIPDVALPGIDPASTRRVLAQWGQQPGAAAVWVARGRDGSFCLIMSVGTTRGASSCTPLEDAASTGVHLDLLTQSGGSVSASWNLSAGLLELSPFASGTDVARSVTASPTP